MEKMQHLKKEHRRAVGSLYESVKLFTQNERRVIAVKQEQMLINSEINALRSKLDDLADELIKLDDSKAVIVGKIEMASRETYDAGENIKEALMELEIDATSGLVSDGYRCIKNAASVLGMTDLDLINATISPAVRTPITESPPIKINRNEREKMTLEEYEQLPKVKLADYWFWVHDHCTTVIDDQLWLELGDFEIELTKNEIEYRASEFLRLVREDLLKDKYKL